MSERGQSVKIDHQDVNLELVDFAKEKGAKRVRKPTVVPIVAITLDMPQKLDVCITLEEQVVYFIVEIGKQKAA